MNSNMTDLEDSYNMIEYWDDEDDEYENNLKQARYSMKVVSMVLYCITFGLGIPGNAIVIWIAGVKMKKAVTPTWYVNLAVADLLCCLATPILMPFIQWPYGDGMATLMRVMTVVVDLNMFASVFTLTLISLDRFALIIRPIWAYKHRSISRAWLLCGLTWLLALLFSLIRNLPKAFIARAVFGFLIPLLVMIVCYLLIARKRSVGRFQAKSGGSFKSQKGLQIMLGVVTAFFMCWMPIYIVTAVAIYGKLNSIRIAHTVSDLAFSLACFNSCLNPVLYVFMGQDFKDKVKISLHRIFDNLFREDVPQSPGSGTSDPKSPTTLFISPFSGK